MKEKPPEIDPINQSPASTLLSLDQPSLMLIENNRTWFQSISQTHFEIELAFLN
jgi:hypothetical protein